MLLCVCVCAQVYCNIPPSEAEQEWRLVEEVVAAECCPETVARIRDTGAKVVGNPVVVVVVVVDGNSDIYFLAQRH